MASVVTRKLKTGIFLYGKYLDPATQTWKMKALEAKKRHEAHVEIDAYQKKVDEDFARGVSARTDPQCAELLETWLGSLSNRSKAEDDWRARKYLLPRFGEMKIAALTKSEVIRWLDELKRTHKQVRKRKAGKGPRHLTPTKPVAPKLLSGATQRKLFNLLSRFCSWATARDYLPANPCRAVPTGERRQDAPKDGEARWLQDEEKVKGLIFALGPNLGLMFATCNRGGLRVGEVAGLRIGDTDTLPAEGVLRVRHSYDGRLKEDKGGPVRKVKYTPIADPTVAVALLELAARRRAELVATRGGGEPLPADDDAQLFDHLPDSARACRKALNRAWRAAGKAVGGVGGLSWYECSRHTFASRALAAGARYEEVSRALGHSSVAVTARYYDRHQERSFASLPSVDLGAATPDGKVLKFPRHGARHGARLQSDEGAASDEAEKVEVVSGE
jgi:integrase